MKPWECWMTARERKKAAGKRENGASRQNRRPGSQKTGRETKIAVRKTKTRAGTQKTQPGSENSLRARGSLTSDVRQGDGRRGRPPGGAVSTRVNGANGRDVPSPFQHDAGRPPTSGRLFGGHAGPAAWSWRRARAPPATPVSGRVDDWARAAPVMPGFRGGGAPPEKPGGGSLRS